jgi:WD40 repeat protein
MTGLEAITLVDTLLRASRLSQGLNDTQSAVFLEIWVGYSYKEIANRQGYELDYIKQIAAQLWKLMGQALGEKVSKSNIQSVLRRYRENHPNPCSIQDWGEATDVSIFYGRQTDLQTLETWTLSLRCKTVGIFGLGGMGKTSLSVKLAQQVQAKFEVVIWRSLRQAPPLSTLLNEIMPILMGSQLQESSTALLMEQLRTKRCLLILDNVESILQEGIRSGEYLPNYEPYGRLFEQICDEPHQSCLVLTGREKPGGITLREGTELPVRSLKLQGLSFNEGQHILTAKGIEPTPTQGQTLINYFGGNPLALKIAATTIQTLFGGNTQAFLAQNTTVFSTLWDLLAQQFQRLSPLQQQIMYWLAIHREGVTPDQLQAELLPKVTLHKVLAALETLSGRSLIERALPNEAGAAGLTQQPVVMEYVTEHFLQTVQQEILGSIPHLLSTHFLIEAQAQDYNREAQLQLIVQPLTERLLAHFPTQFQLETHLRKLLTTLRASTADAAGYASGNILNLFCYLKTDLTGFDFSHLTLRQAYLLNTPLRDTNFIGAHFKQTIFAETFGGVVSVAYSPDGQWLATGDTKGDIQLWNAQTLVLRSRCRGHQHWVWAIAFSPNNQYLASASDDYRIMLWDVETGQCLRTYEGHTHSVTAVAFSYDGQLIASCSQDATVRIWRVNPGRQDPVLCALEGHSSRVWAIAFSPDLQTLASCGEDGTIRLWDIVTGTCHAQWHAHDHWVRSLAYSPDGQTLASSSYDATLKLWNPFIQTCLQTLQGHRQSVTAIAFSPDGQQLASSSFDRTLKLWDASTGECIKTFLGHTNRVWSVAFRPSSGQLASGGDDHAAKIWDLKTGRCIKTLVGHTNAALSVALCPHQHILASGHEDQTIRLWNLNNGEIVQTLREHTNRVWSVAFHPHRPILASGSADTTLKLWDSASGQCLQTLIGHTSWVWTVVFSPDGTKLASSSYDHTVKLWDVATGQCLQTLQGHTSSVVSVAFSPNGQWLASCEFDGLIKFWNAETGECCQTLKGHANSVWSVAFSPDSVQLLSASFDQTLKLWDVATGNCLQTFTGHEGGITTAQFSPEGQFILSGSLDRTLKLWDVQTGACLKTLSGHADLIYRLLVALVPIGENPSSLTAFTASLDENIKVWDLETGDCRETWRSPRPYEGMQIHNIHGLTKAQTSTLTALGAVTFPRKSGHFRRVDNRRECSDETKTPQDIYRRAKS